MTTCRFRKSQREVPFSDKIDISLKDQPTRGDDQIQNRGRRDGSYHVRRIVVPHTTIGDACDSACVNNALALVS